MIVLSTNHKVGDVVYVSSDCVRRGIIKQINFVSQSVLGTPYTLSYDILYDGFSFNTTVASAIDFNIAGTGSPRAVGSPTVSPGSPVGSPHPFGSPQLSLALEEEINGGDIYTTKTAALNAFGDTLA